MDGLDIRWLIRNDMKDVMRIDNMGFKHPYTEEDFLLLLKQRNNIGMVGSIGGHIVAFMIYELIKDRIDLKTLAVDADVRRVGIGQAMIDKLISKLSLEPAGPDVLSQSRIHLRGDRTRRLRRSR